MKLLIIENIIMKTYNLQEIKKDIYSEKHYINLLCNLDRLKEEIKRIYDRKKELRIEFGDNPEYLDISNIIFIEISPKFIVFEYENKEYRYQREELNTTNLFNDIWEEHYKGYLQNRKNKREKYKILKEEEKERYELYQKLKREFK